MTAFEPIEGLGPNDHARGAMDPKVTLIEYGDYDCPHTRAAQAVVDRLASEHRELCAAFRPFPLRRIHENAEILARIAAAAGNLGRFWEMHDHLMSHRAAIGPRDVEHDARAVGLDLNALNGELARPEVAASVEHHLQRGKQSGVHSTPTFFFNGALHDGHYDYDTLRERLLDALGRSR